MKGKDQTERLSLKDYYYTGKEHKGKHYYKYSIKICPICNRSFRPSREKQIYCSRACFLTKGPGKGLTIPTSEMICVLCNRKLPIAQFAKNKSAKYGISKVCKDCKQVQNRNSHLKNNYGISIEQFDEMLKLQNGTCAICGKKAEKEKRKLCVDHNHKTGHIRGLLCNFCNSKLLKYIKDRKFLVIKMVSYLQKALVEDKEWK